VITGAMAAMWKATKYASYILGDYEVKVLRANINQRQNRTTRSIEDIV
jgi:hypothetical protein